MSLYAIDNCPELEDIYDTEKKRCDGLLVDGAHHVLVELKNRKRGQWMQDGRKQIEATLSEIRRLDEGLREKIRYAYVCNKMMRKAHASRSNLLNSFRKDYGVILRDDATIDLDKLS